MDKKSRDIVNNILTGNDQKVIDDLYKDVYPNVKRYLIKNNGTAEEAEDSFQEALMKFYKQVLSGDFNLKYKVHGYVYTMSIRLWLNEVKRKKPTVSFDKLDHLVLKSDTLENSFEFDKSDENIVLNLFSKLGEKCRNLLHSSIYSDMLNEDIMIRFGYQSVAAVKMQHKRCKQKMIELIKLNPELETELRYKGKPN